MRKPFIFFRKFFMWEALSMWSLSNKWFLQWPPMLVHIASYTIQLRKTIMKKVNERVQISTTLTKIYA